MKCGGRCLPIGEECRILTAASDGEGVVNWKGSAAGSLRRVFRSLGLRLCGDLPTRKTLSLSELSARGDTKRSGDENHFRASNDISAQLADLLRMVLPRMGVSINCRMLFGSLLGSLLGRAKLAVWNVCRWISD